MHAINSSYIKTLSLINEITRGEIKRKTGTSTVYFYFIDLILE